VNRQPEREQRQHCARSDRATDIRAARGQPHDALGGVVAHRPHCDYVAQMRGRRVLLLHPVSAHVATPSPRLRASSSLRHEFVESS
jgi:hypothetical protein